MIVIESIETNNSSVFAGLAPSSSASLAPSSIANPTSDSIAGPALGSVNNSASSSGIILALGAITGHVALVIIDPKTTFFYGKQVTIKDYISSKLYIKRTIWIRGIPFDETIDA